MVSLLILLLSSRGHQKPVNKKKWVFLGHVLYNVEGKKLLLCCICNVEESGQKNVQQAYQGVADSVTEARSLRDPGISTTSLP